METITLQNMLAGLAALAIATAAIALTYARREYRIRGKLSVVGSLLLCAMLFVPNLLLHYTAGYELPATPIDYIGVAIGVTGLVICAAGCGEFRSTSKVLCLAAPTLTRTGIYRWSRNPQYVGWFLFLLGFALNEPSVWAFSADELKAFCQKTPRYIGT